MSSMNGKDYESQGPGDDSQHGHNESQDLTAVYERMREDFERMGQELQDDIYRRDAMKEDLNRRKKQVAEARSALQLLNIENESLENSIRKNLATEALFKEKTKSVRVKIGRMKKHRSATEASLARCQRDLEELEKRPQQKFQKAATWEEMATDQKGKLQTFQSLRNDQVARQTKSIEELEKRNALEVQKLQLEEAAARERYQALEAKLASRIGVLKEKKKESQQLRNNVGQLEGCLATKKQRRIELLKERKVAKKLKAEKVAESNRLRQCLLEKSDSLEKTKADREERRMRHAKSLKDVEVEIALAQEELSGLTLLTMEKEQKLSDVNEEHEAVTEACSNKKEELAVVQKELEDAGAKIARLSDERDNIRENATQRYNQICEKEAILQNQESVVQELKAKLIDATKEKEALNIRKANILTETQSMRENLKDIKKENQDLQKELGDTRILCSGVAAEVDTLTQKQENLDNELNMVEQTASEEAYSCGDNSEIALLTEELDSLNTKLAEVNDEKEKVELHINDQTKELSTISQDVEMKTAALAKAERKLEQNQKQFNVKKEQVDACVKKYKQDNEELLEWKHREFVKCREQLVDLEKRKDQYRAYKDEYDRVQPMVLSAKLGNKKNEKAETCGGRKSAQLNASPSEMAQEHDDYSVSPKRPKNVPFMESSHPGPIFAPRAPMSVQVAPSTYHRFTDASRSCDVQPSLPSNLVLESFRAGAAARREKRKQQRLAKKQANKPMMLAKLRDANFIKEVPVDSDSDFAERQKKKHQASRRSSGIEKEGLPYREVPVDSDSDAPESAKGNESKARSNPGHGMGKLSTSSGRKPVPRSAATTSLPKGLVISMSKTVTFSSGVGPSNSKKDSKSPFKKPLTMSPLNTKSAGPSKMKTVSSHDVAANVDESEMTKDDSDSDFSLGLGNSQPDMPKQPEHASSSTTDKPEIQQKGKKGKSPASRTPGNGSKKGRRQTTKKTKLDGKAPPTGKKASGAGRKADEAKGSNDLYEFVDDENVGQLVIQ